MLEYFVALFYQYDLIDFLSWTGSVFESNTEKWANKTFGKAELGDKRRAKRLINLASDMADGVGKSIVKSGRDAASIEGAYQFIENELIDHNAIAHAGFQATAEEVKRRRLVLTIEDITSLIHSVCNELGNSIIC
ncbi:hypothetical protein CJF42_08775 [Pseudoalteromonas sp. NBT06-2]|nr:hypothetical protein CJF42_08775 [Pseudoalteromonas sp. NBT06-2]